MSDVVLNSLVVLLVAIVVLLLMIYVASRRYLKRLINEMRLTSEHLDEVMAQYRTEISSAYQSWSATQSMNAIHMLRALGTLDFRARPTVQSRLATLDMASACDFEDSIYSLERLVRSVKLDSRVTNSASDVMLCTVAIGKEYEITVGPCLDSHAYFARRQGYGCCVLNGPAERLPRPPAWMKIPLIAKLLAEGVQNIVFIDADAMITNCAKSVESYFRRLVEADACMLLTEDEDGVNSGVMFIRNCVKTKALIELIWLYDADVGNNTWEQFSLRFLIDNFPEVRRQILVESNPKEFNSFPLEREIVCPTAATQCWSRGDFICHFSGIREPYLSRYIERYARALKIDDAVATPPSRIRVSDPDGAEDCTEKRRGGTVTLSELGERVQFGNQLFQISAVLGYAARYDARAVLPHWRCCVSQRDYDGYFPDIRKYYGQPTKSELYEEPNFTYARIPYRRHIDLRGYFQCESYFSHVKDQVADLFGEPDAIRSELDTFCASRGLRDFDAIHFRSYSHPTNDRSNIMEKLPDAYYVAAIGELDGEGPLIICTDNKEYVGEFLRRHEIRRPIILTTFSDSLMDFYLLSRAQRLAISNSTFSWWAAYLGRKKAQIIAPHRYFWFSKEVRKNPFWDPRDLYPASFQELLL